MNNTNPFTNPPQRPDFDPYKHVGDSAGPLRYLQYLFFLAALALVAKAGWSFWHMFEPATPRGAVASTSADTTTPLEGRLGEYERPVSPSDRFMVDENNPSTSLNVDRSSVPGNSVPSPSRAHLEWAKSLQRTTMNLARSVRESCDEWRIAIDRWNAVAPPLFESADGKLLAADPDTVRSFRAIYEQQRSSSDRCNEVLQIVTDLTVNVASSIDDPNDGYVPASGTSSRLEQLVDEARSAALSYQTALEQVQALLGASRQTGKSSDKTLKVAIEEQKQADQMAAIAEARERMDAARRKADAKVAEAQAEAIRVAGELEAKQIMDAVAAAKVRQQAEAERLQAAAEAEKRNAAMQRDLGDIRRYLAPFVAKGYAQPNGYHNTQLADEVPVSWSRLAASGALKPTREGMEQLMRYATVQNDRPHDGFPQYVGGDYAWAQTNKNFVKRAQELLNTHGQAMVEAGLLSK